MVYIERVYAMESRVYLDLDSIVESFRQLIENGFESNYLHVRL